MKNLTPEMIENAKKAKSPDELLALAKENEVELTEEEAKAYFAQLNPTSGELSDDDLDNVAGGCSDKNGNMVVTVGALLCGGGPFLCKCGGKATKREIYVLESLEIKVCAKCGAKANCGNCQHCVYEKGLWKCML